MTDKTSERSRQAAKGPTSKNSSTGGPNLPPKGDPRAPAPTKGTPLHLTVEEAPRLMKALGDNFLLAPDDTAAANDENEA